MQKVINWLLEEKFFILLLVISAGFWWVVFQPEQLIEQWRGVLGYLIHNLSSIWDSEKVDRMFELRWVDTYDSGLIFYLSKVFYSKYSLLTDQLYSYMSFASGRFFFQSGDGGVLSPTGVSPIVSILFPFWIYGFMVALGRRSRAIIVWFVFTSFAFLIGKRTIAFLFPVMLVNVYFSRLGIFEISSKRLRYAAIFFVSLVGLYELGRALWL